MIKKKIIFILFLLSSCGYQPLFVGKNTNELIFKDINSFGEKNINRKLISISGFKKDEQDFIYSKLTINSKKDIVETSKNAKGKVVSYKMIINLDLTFEDKNMAQGCWGSETPSSFAHHPLLCGVGRTATKLDDQCLPREHRRENAHSCTQPRIWHLISPAVCAAAKLAI